MHVLPVVLELLQFFPPQVKNLQMQLEQESSKRVVVQSDLKTRMQDVDRLRCSEKQLKQEINTALESKRSLEFQLAQLTKYVSELYDTIIIIL